MARGDLVVEGFPAGLHQRLRVLAARQNTTIKALVIAACEAECGTREAGLDGADQQANAG